MEKYRDFIIDAAWIGFQGVHKDYDGPEDNRAFHALTVEAVKIEIDEWYEDQE